MKIGLLCILLGGTLTPGAAWAHGLERHYGTSINGSGAASPTGTGGSPDFTLLALEAHSAALERALADGHRGEIRERARRLPRLVEELGRRAQHLEPGMRSRAGEAIAALSETAARLHAAAREPDAASIRAELAEFRNLLNSMRDFVRQSQPR